MEKPNSEPIDPNNDYVHKVERIALDRYLAYLDPKIKAVCGKVWAPKLPMDLNKPRCSICFPKRSLRAIAA